MHCFLISICKIEPHFNDGTNERYNLIIHQKKLEQLRNFCALKVAAINVTTRNKKQYQITEKKSTGVTGEV